MTLSGIMAVILRYFTEFVHNLVLQRLLCTSVSKSTFDSLRPY